MKNSVIKLILKTGLLVLIFPFFLAKGTYAQQADIGSLRIPPSPNAAAIAQYGAVPVNLASGTMSIDIPLFSASSSHLNMPISISYHASGIRTNQEAGNVGLGWALNAGGVISRTIHGKADDDPVNGYQNVDFDPYDLSSAQMAYQNGWDTEADVFSFNFMGHSGKFVMDKEGEIHFYSDSKLEFEKQGGVEIIAWKVTDLQGIEYEFEATEYTFTEIDNEGGGSATNYITSWYLTQIIHPSKDDVMLKYSDSVDIILPQAITASRFITNAQVPCPITNNPNLCSSSGWSTPIPATITTSSKLLTDIHTKYYDISLVYSNRDDVGKQIDHIEKRTKSGLLDRKIDFKYEYFNQNGGTNSKRLKLKTIQESGPGESLPPYIFTYKNPDYLATKYSYSADHWGFQNDNNELFLSYPQTNADIVEFGNEKRKTSETCLNGMLEQIIYPTGLKRKFTFSPHRYGYSRHYGNPIEVISNEFKYLSCIDFDGESCLKKEKFVISPGYQSITLTGSGSCSDSGNTPPLVECFAEITILDQNGQPISGFPISPSSIPYGGITFYLEPGIYTIVLEIPPEGAQLGEEAWVRLDYILVNNNPHEDLFPLAGGARIVSIEDDDGIRRFEYKNFGDDRPSGVLTDIPFYSNNAVRTVECASPSGGLPNTNINCLECWGKQLSSSSYNNMLSGSHIFYKYATEILPDGSRKEYEFDFETDYYTSSGLVPAVPSSSREQLRGQLKRVKMFTNENILVYEEENNYLSDQINLQWSYRVHFPSPQCLFTAYIGKYRHYTYWKRLENKIVRRYGSDGSQALETIERFHYNDDYYTLASQDISSGSDIKTTTYKYAPDLIGIDPFASSMTNTHYMVGIPLETMINNGTGGGSKISYKLFGGKVLPHKYYSATEGPGYELDTDCDLNNWKCNITVNIYNDDGFPTSINIRNQINPETLVWETGNRAGLLDYRQYESRVWDYKYNDLRLLEEIEDHNGIKSAFIYDGLNRLEHSTTNNGRITNDYIYEYGVVNGGENKITSTTSYSDGTPSLTIEQIFDGFGRKTEERKLAYTQSGGDYITSMKYDEMGRVKEECDPGSGGCTEYFYEKSPLNRIMKTKPAGASKYVFTNHGVEDNLFSVETIDEDGRTSTTFTDIFGRTKKIKDGLGNETVYTYNDRDQVKTITPPGGIPYEYTYYDDGLLHTKTIPDKGMHTYTYTPQDQIETELLPNNYELTFDYHDVYNDFLEEVLLDGAVIKHYNMEGISGWIDDQTIYIVDKHGPTTPLHTDFTYDDLGRITLEDKKMIDNTFVFSDYHYNDLGNMTNANKTIKGPDGNHIPVYQSFNYPKGYRLTGTNFTIDGITTTLNDLTYDDNDWLRSSKIGDELQTISYGYNQRGWLTSINSIDATYEEDPCGPEPEGPEVSCDDLFQIVYNILISFNCEDLETGNPTILKVDISAESQENGQITGQQSSGFSIPLNGFIGDPSIASLPNQENTILLNGGNNTDVNAGIIALLLDCLTSGDTETLLNYINGQIAVALANLGLSNDLSPTGPSNEPPFGGSSLFGMEMNYEDGNPELEAPGQHNGNISWMKWRVAGEDVHAYGFTYDALNRLTKAKYGFTDKCEILPADKYSVPTITYDARGNILSLARNGFQGMVGSTPQFGPIDLLSYEYSGGSNELLSVKDYTSHPKGFGADVSTYYYNHGNLVEDTGKELEHISYNYMDLPVLIESAYGVIENFYDADGMKQKTVYTPFDLGTVPGPTPAPITRHYIGGAEYKDNKIEAIYHEEGRYTYEKDENGNFIARYHEYFLKDHLGNTRVRFADKNGDKAIQVSEDDPDNDELLHSSHYYPFGMEMEGPTFGQGGKWSSSGGAENRYTYNGKEAIEEFNVGWLDYGARYYDASIGRWTTTDPLAEKMNSWSQYNYVYNNPISFIDPDGRRVDVSDLMNGGTESDTRLLINLMASLSEITGSVISVETDKDGNSFLAEGECRGECKSVSGSGFVSQLINDKSGAVFVKNNDRNTKKDRSGRDAKEFGSQAYANGEIFLDNKQISSIQESINNAGLDGNTMNTGLVFLHEALHTKYGASFTRGDGGIYVDPKGFTASHSAGETVSRINEFRVEMGLPIRVSYGGHNPSQLRFQEKGKPIINVPITYK